MRSCLRPVAGVAPRFAPPVALRGSHVDRRTAERRTGRARRPDRAVADRPPAPVRAQPAHAQRRAGRSDRGLDGGVRLDQPGPGRRAGRHPRRPRPAARGAEARARRGAGDPLRAPERGAEAGVPHRRQPARPAGGLDEALLAQELAWLRDESFDLDLVGFDATELERLLALADGEAARRTMPTTRSPSRRRIRSAGRATYGSSATIACCAATPRCWPTSSGCSAGSSRT